MINTSRAVLATHCTTGQVLCHPCGQLSHTLRLSIYSRWHNICALQYML